MGVSEVISARVETANGLGTNEAWKKRVARLGVAHDLFRSLEKVAVELDDARRHGLAAALSDEDGDCMSAAFDRQRGELARRAAGLELFSAAVGFFALARAAGLRQDMLSGLVASLEKEEAEWLLAVVGAGL